MDIHVELSGGMLNIEVWAGERFECHLYLDVDGSQWRREVYPEREVGLGQSPKERWHLRHKWRKRSLGK